MSLSTKEKWKMPVMKFDLGSVRIQSLIVTKQKKVHVELLMFQILLPTRWSNQTYQMSWNIATDTIIYTLPPSKSPTHMKMHSYGDIEISLVALFIVSFFSIPGNVKYCVLCWRWRQQQNGKKHVMRDVRIWRSWNVNHLTPTTNIFFRRWKRKRSL